MNDAADVPEEMLPPRSSEGRRDQTGMFQRNTALMADTEQLLSWLNDQEISTRQSSYFVSKAHLLIVGIWAYICFARRFGDRRELKTLCEMVAYDELRMRKYIRMICGLSWSPEAFLPRALGEFGVMSPETFSGVYAEVCELLNSPSFREMSNLSLARSIYIEKTG